MKTIKLIKLIFFLLTFTIIKVNAQTQYIKGLTVMVEFTDAPFNHSLDSVASMMNQIGFNSWGNQGSMREYYLTQSAGKIDLSSTVIKVSLAHNVDYYYGPNATGKDLSDILDAVNARYPAGFTDLTTMTDADGFTALKHFHILTKRGGGAWAFGPQSGTNSIKNNGSFVRISSGSITNYGPTEKPTYNTISHETGHAIFSWGDYYNQNTEIGQIGHYCLMGSGGTVGKPMPISAPLRYGKNWISNVVDITNANTQTFSITTNDYTQVYKYTNPKNTNEFFLISAHKHGGYYLAVDGDNLPLDQGLAVWYVDEGRDHGKVSPYIKLIQADGVDEMNNPNFQTPELSFNLRGDLTDLYDNQFPTLNDASNPLLRWKDGSLTGLSLSEISAVSTTMTFKFNKPASGCTGIATYCTYPCIYNQGDVVQYNGVKYQSLVNNLYNVTPGTAAQWWKDLGLCGASNAAPTVSLTSPTVLSYRAPATVAIAANATDDVSISKVEFYQGTTLLNTDLASPYSYSWTGVAAGNYTITAKAFDGAGLATTSSAINITVSNNSAPVVSLTSPTVLSYRSPATVTIAANATDDVSVSKVEFYQGATLLNTDVTSPYSYSWTGVTAGSYSILARAYDGEGFVTSSSSVSIVVSNNTAPAVSLTAPTILSYRAPATITIAANATDDLTVSKVEFYNGATLLNTDVTSPYSFSWSGVPSGNYTITAKAYDGEGLITTSSAKNIVATNNTAPVITVTAPLPANGINPKYLVGGSQTVSANVNDDVAVSKVVFTLLKTGTTITDLTSPFAATFTNLPAPNADGSLAYTITAYDNENATSSASVFVYKNRVPSVTISTPAANATVSNNVVTIGALVFDTDWTSGKVEYYNGVTKLGETLTNIVGSTAVNFTWNNVANGTYTITAKATDDMGESSTSASVTFTVNKVSSACTAPLYSATAAYGTGAVVQYNGIKYTANWWTQGAQPDLNNGPSGSGQPWTSNGACNAKVAFLGADVATITSMYPNPSNGTFIIESKSNSHAQILDNFGKKVAAISLVKGKNEITVPLSTGIYYLKSYNKVTKMVIE